MKIAFPMHVGERLQSLIGNVPDFYMWEFALLLLKLVNVAIEVFEYKVELIIFFDEFE